MSLPMTTRILDVELSVKVTAVLVKKYGDRITLRDMDGLPEPLWPETLGRRGRAELKEAIQNAKAYESRTPPTSGSSINPPPRGRLRDEFAMAALTGAVSSFGIPKSERQINSLAECAWLLADAMLEARK